jgi:hypothetical protein
MNTNLVACEFQLQPSWELSGKNLSLARRLPASPMGRAARARQRAILISTSQSNRSKTNQLN